MPTPNCVSVKRKGCASCVALIINGVYCHERGCPSAWKDSLRECKECGTEFVPTYSHQRCCDEDCARNNEVGF